MEQPLKARLIGASILVLLAVALVPELLSGPKDTATGGAPGSGAKSTRTVTIDLGGAVAESARLEPRTDTVPTPATTPSLPTVDSSTDVPAPQATVPARGDQAADSERGAPPPVTGPVPAPGPATTAAARPATTATAPAKSAATTPAKVEPVAAPVASAKGAYAVQVGAFGAEATARKLVGELKADGMTAYIAPLAKAGKTLHRVRVGPVPDRAAADKLAATLKARGLPVSVVSGG